MDFLTWSPFQDEQTRKICSHLNKEERAKVVVLGIFAGAFLAFIFAAFLALGLAYRYSSLSPRACLIFLVVIPIIAVVGICYIRKRVKTFLASTAWAKEEKELNKNLRA